MFDPEKTLTLNSLIAWLAVTNAGSAVAVYLAMLKFWIKHRIDKPVEELKMEIKKVDEHLSEKIEQRDKALSSKIIDFGRISDIKTNELKLGMSKLKDDHEKDVIRLSEAIKEALRDNKEASSFISNKVEALEDKLSKVNASNMVLHEVMKRIENYITKS